MRRYFDSWPRYVPVAARREQAAKKIKEIKKKSDREMSPVEIPGRKIVTTFWGDAWCKNLEAYSDYENRLPRGRSYVRNGFVIDLTIEAGRVCALVSGSDIYNVEIKIKPLVKTLWANIKSRCAGQIHSLVELLRGAISKGVMEIVTRKGEGLFPSPKEIEMRCSCPDWATMCKHVAATLYGVGARLDHAPEMLFTLRGVNPTDIVEAAMDISSHTGKTEKATRLSSDDLSSVFGIDIQTAESSTHSAEALPVQAKPVKKPKRVLHAKESVTVGKKPKSKTKPVVKKSSSRARVTRADVVMSVKNPNRKG